MATAFTNGTATATSASDLNALITAADKTTNTSGVPIVLTINISGTLALNTQAAVPDGENLTITNGTGKVAEQFAVPDIAAVNLQSGVSLVITGSNNAVLDGGNTVRGLFAYSGNLTVNNLTIQDTVAQGGAGSNAGFAGGGGAGLGGGLFVAANANVTLNDVSFSGTKAIGGAGGNNTGGGTADWGGGGGLGGNGGAVFGGLYFAGGGGVGRTAVGATGSYRAVTNYGNTDDTSIPGAGIIVGGASGGNGAPVVGSTNSPHTQGGLYGGGGGLAEGTGHNPSFPSPDHYYGGGGGGGGVGGHSGYSKVSPYNTKEAAGGGGNGGFGGGGGAGYYFGGNGGFGGGGGAGQYGYGGNGGFGGGGGGLPDTKQGSPGFGKYARGGFGAGNAGGGYNIGNGRTPQYALSGGDAGGGGLGAGGAVFIQSGGILTIGGAGTVAGGAVVGGAGGAVTESDGNGAGTAGTAGSAFGSGIFIQNNSTSLAQGVTFAPGSGQTLTVSGVIADEQDSGGTGANATLGKLLIQGGGTLRLTGSNTFAGGSSIGASSTLDLGASGAGGLGTISFGAGSFGRLQVENAALTGNHLFNTVGSFAAGDTFDFSGLTFRSGATANIVSNTLSVVSNGVTNTVTLASPGTNLGLVAVQDAGTGTSVITTNFTISTEAQLLADLADVNSGGVDAAGNVNYTFNFLNAVPLVTGGETINLISGSSIAYAGTGFTTGNTMTVNVGELIADAAGALGSGGLAIGGSGTVALDGFAQTIGDLSGSGAVLLQGANLTEGTSNSTTFSGSITGTAGEMLIKQGSGVLTLSGTNSLPGGLTINAGEVILANAGAANGGGPVSFKPGVDTTLGISIAPPVSGAIIANTIEGFAAGDTIDITGLAHDPGGHADMNYSTNVLSVTADGDTFTLQFNKTESFSGDFFHLDPDTGTGTTITESNAPCYCPGTLILTTRGEVLVEDLEIGDRVVTLRGEARRIKWIGRRSYNGRFALGKQDILPVCFKAGSLSGNIPRRDLWISPHHAMYLEGVLIEAKDLVNGVSVIQAEEVDRVDYFHIELDSHDVILAEGAWSETFVDDDSRGMFHNVHEHRVLYPGEIRRPARYCAPRLDTGYEVEAARRLIAEQAGLAAAVDLTIDLRGCVDKANDEAVEGWAQNPDYPEAPVCLDVYAGGQLIGQTLANRYREDLERGGLGSGRHSFSFTLPDGLMVLPGTVDVRRSLDGARLARSHAALRTARAMVG